MHTSSAACRAKPWRSAEGMGFEPMDGLHRHNLANCSFNHSGNPPVNLRPILPNECVEKPELSIQKRKISGKLYILPCLSFTNKIFSLILQPESQT